MSKGTEPLNVSHRKLIEEKVTITNRRNKEDKTTFQQRLASISKKLNLCLLVNYK